MSDVRLQAATAHVGITQAFERRIRTLGSRQRHEPEAARASIRTGRQMHAYHRTRSCIGEYLLEFLLRDVVWKVADVDGAIALLRRSESRRFWARFSAPWGL
jgi:hypothetical protein